MTEPVSIGPRSTFLDQPVYRRAKSQAARRGRKLIEVSDDLVPMKTTDARFR